MRPIPKDKREIIITARERGEKQKAIAHLAGVAVGSVYNICRLYNQSNTLEPKPFPGKRSLLTAEQLAEIKKTVETENEITLEKLIKKLNLPIKKSRLSVILRKMGLSSKKRRLIHLKWNDTNDD